MALKIPLPSPNGTWQLPTAGTHLGTCWSVVFLGSQPHTYQGEASIKPKLRISFELQDEHNGEAKPLVISRNYNYSWHPNAGLRADLENWLGIFSKEKFDEFDLAGLIGRSAILRVQHDTGDRGPFAFISSVVAVPPGQPERARTVNRPVVLSPLDFNFNLYQEQPEWLRKQLQAAPEWAAVLKGGSPSPAAQVVRLQRQLEAPSLGRDLEDEVPF